MFLLYCRQTVAFDFPVEVERIYVCHARYVIQHGLNFPYKVGALTLYCPDMRLISSCEYAFSGERTALIIRSIKVLITLNPANSMSAHRWNDIFFERQLQNNCHRPLSMDCKCALSGCLQIPGQYLFFIFSKYSCAFLYQCAYDRRT